MSDDTNWFAPKRYGFGFLPISWQGWALTIGFVLVCVVTGLLFARKPAVFIAVLVPITVTFITIAARTTKGGWRWRWGEKE
jgi:hypothetical protein